MTYLYLLIGSIFTYILVSVSPIPSHYAGWFTAIPAMG